MNFFDITSSLNEFAKSFLFEFEQSKINFFHGEIFSTCASVCSKISPYSVVAVLHSQDSFEINGKELKSALKASGLRPVNVIIDQTSPSIETLAVSLPENVRLLLLADSSLMDYSQRLARELKLPLVACLKALPDRLVFDQEIPESLNFVFSQDLEFDIAELYQNVVSKIVSLLDIKLKQFFKIIPKNLALTDTFIERLDLALKENDGQKLFKSRIELELLEWKLGHISNRLDVKASLAIVKMTAENLNGRYLAVPDYVNRAKELNELYGENYYETLNKILSQIKEQKMQTHLNDVKKGLSALASIYLFEFDKIIKRFKALNGKSSLSVKQTMQTIKRLGDIHYYNNTVSLLRDNGYLA